MAPNKKYLSLEEAATQLGIKPDELIRLREKGEVRGFADRGTWKFKADDVAEFRRRRQPDSDPDIQIIDEDEEDFGHQRTVIRKGTDAKSDSDVRMLPSGDKSKSRLTGSSAEVPTLDLHQSDSDVRLVEPAKKPKKGSDSDVTLVKPNLASKSDSDSDVKLVDIPQSAPESDSDVKLLEPHESMFDSDSDVRLTGADSDVRLASDLDSDSDVKLISPKSKGSKRSSDSDVTLLSKQPLRGDAGSQTQDMEPLVSGNRGSVLSDEDDSSIALGADSGIQLAGDSGITLSTDSGLRLPTGSGDRLGGDSGIRFDSGGGGLLDDESDIRLGTGSGIRLGASSGIRIGGDSGIRLADDSGVQLKKPMDSGISLEGADSGVRLADSGINLGGDSGIKLMSADSSSHKLKGGSSKKLKKTAPPPEDDLDTTSPMLLSGLDDDDDRAQHTLPLMDVVDPDDASASDLDMFDSSDTSEMQSLGESGQNVVMFDDDEEDSAPVAKKPRQKTVEESIFEVDDAGDEELEELEVSDEELSGENEIDDLAFDDDDEELDDSFSAGTSKLGFGGAQKVAVAQEVEWSGGVFGLLVASLSVLIIGSLMSADLLRAVWAQSDNPGFFVSTLAGLWK